MDVDPTSGEELEALIKKVYGPAQRGVGASEKDVGQLIFNHTEAGFNTDERSDGAME